MAAIRIGRYSLGIAPFSMIIVFIVLSGCAVATAIAHAGADSPMPFILHLIINEGLALIATLIYGIFAHLITTVINRFSK